MASYPSFIGGSYGSQSPVASQERTVNFYPERIEVPGGKAQIVLYPTPGVSQFASVAPAGPIRALCAMSGRCFAVVGATLYEIFEDGTMTSRGTVEFTSRLSTISLNGDGGGQLFVTSNQKGFLLDLTTNVFTTVRASATTFGGMLDGYFLALDATTSTLWVSDLLDGTTWDPTQFAQRSSSPDRWLSLLVTQGEAWLFGETNTDIWYNAGTFPFPLTPNTSGRLPYGIAAVASPAEVAGRVIWLARTAHGDQQVVQAQGFTVQPISTSAVQFAMAEYVRLGFGVSDAIGQTYDEQGHVFYVLTFPAANATWVYDVTTQLWTERGTWIAEENRYEAWRPLYQTFAFGRHLAGDRSAGTIYQMSTNLTVDVDGRPIRRLRRAPSLSSDNRRLFYDTFELVVEPGLGLVAGQGSDPTVELRISDDDGKTFRAIGSRSAGAIGRYRTRVKWRRLGSARPGRVFEVVVTDPIPWRLLDAYLTMRPAA